MRQSEHGDDVDDIEKRRRLVECVANDHAHGEKRQRDRKEDRVEGGHIAAQGGERSGCDGEGDDDDEIFFRLMPGRDQK